MNPGENRQLHMLISNHEGLKSIVPEMVQQKLQLTLKVDYKTVDWNEIYLLHVKQ